MILRLVSYNIRHGGRGREAPLAAVIGRLRPDVVVLQEASDPAVVERLAAATGLTHWGAARRESLGYISREPMAHAEWHHPRFSRHAFLELVPRGEPVRIFGVHLSAVHAAWTERRRSFEIRALLASIKRHQAGFHVLTGDFNTIAPEDMLDVRRLPLRLRPFVWLSGGRIRWRAIRIVLDANYVDAYRALHPGSPGFSFPTWDPHVRLDYLFSPVGFADRILGCDLVIDDETRAASDHLPLLGEIAV